MDKRRRSARRGKNDRRYRKAQRLMRGRAMKKKRTREKETTETLKEESHHTVASTEKFKPFIILLYIRSAEL